MSGATIIDKGALDLGSKFGDVPKDLLPKKVVYRKYFVMDAGISDIQPTNLVVEDATAHVNLPVLNELTGELGKGVSEDAGWYFLFHGIPTGIVGFHAGQILEEESLEEIEEAMDIEIRRYIRFGFHLVQATRTDSPDRREKLHKRYEDQMADAETKMFDKQTEMLANMEKVFMALGAKLDGGGTIVPADLKPTAENMVDLLADVNDPEQLRQISELALIQAEEVAEAAEDQAEQLNEVGDLDAASATNFQETENAGTGKPTKKKK